MGRVVVNSRDLIKQKHVVGKKSRQVLIFTASVLLIFGTILFWRYIERNNSQASEIYQHIVRIKALNFRHRDQIMFAMKQFTRNTEFEYLSGFNHPPDPKKFSITLFDHTPSLPNYLKSNCVSFPDDAAVFCDASVFDSLPMQFPLKVRNEDKLSPSFLLMWIVGHEVGHIVLKHRRQRTDYELDKKEETPTIDCNNGGLSKLAEVIKIGQTIENEADEFIIKQLKLNPSTAVLAWGQIFDALQWLKQNYASPNAANENCIEVKFSPNLHPPMIVRVLNLSKLLSQEFTDYIERDSLREGFKQFAIRNVPQSQVTAESPLYEGLYTKQTPLSPDVRDVVDTALTSLFTRGPTAFSTVRSAYCRFESNDDLSKKFCSSHKQRYPAKCISSNDSDLQDCVRLTVLSYVECFSYVKPPKYIERICGESTLNYLGEIIEALNNTSASGRDMQWFMFADAALQIRKIKLSKASTKILYDHFSAVVENYGNELGLWFLERSIDEYDDSSGSNLELITDLHANAREYSRRKSQQVQAIYHGEQAVKGWDALSQGAPHPGRAYHRTELARVHLDMGSRMVPGITLPDYEKTHMPLVMNLYREAMSIRGKIRAMASNKYIESYNPVYEQGTSRISSEFMTQSSSEFLSDLSKLESHELDASAEEGQDIIEHANQQFNFSANDVVYALNSNGKCENAFEFLPFALEGLAQHKGDDKDTAMALENLSATHVCAKSGDPQIGLIAAQWAVGIRLRQKGKQRDATKLLNSLLLLWSAAERVGNDRLCAAAIRAAANLLEKEERRHLSAEMSMYVAGVPKSVSRCMQIAAKNYKDPANAKNND